MRTLIIGLFLVVPLWPKGLTAACYTPMKTLGRFPIEKYYKHVNVSNGPAYGSKAYILWRSKTPPHFPPEAFLAHYMNPRKVAEELQWIPTVSKRAANGSRFIHINTEIRRSLIESFGSLKGAMKKLGIELRASSETFQDISASGRQARFILTDDLQLYILHYSQERAIQKQLLVPDPRGVMHSEMLGLIFPRLPKHEGVRVLDDGYLEFSDGELEIRSRNTRFNTAKFIKKNYLK